VKTASARVSATTDFVARMLLTGRSNTPEDEKK
jgi:hypothetical protein